MWKKLGAIAYAVFQLVFLAAFLANVVLGMLFEGRFLSEHYRQRPADGAAIERQIKGVTIYVNSDESVILDWMEVYLPSIWGPSIVIFICQAFVARAQANKRD